MTLLLWGMVLALLIPIAVVCRPCSASFAHGMLRKFWRVSWRRSMAGK